ncbi:androgen-dependent TFPI-regulating protein-like isoform X6 [Agrilus planipennis]|uniref:Androgen-dependent TFPI-regulating protein-like isoform X5 n=1 Tax=Agrilus planipennis TaxID=224129 RepID=A0A7F5RBP1_AGRPL|nr:androgen-dependent TFPI-regulating protein-like isoform X5 [Agrilus planipennis]XP_025833378.1 androgen-dependent TFPI-regulating protein-like isoform X6 [Agrilus planipennis]
MVFMLSLASNNANHLPRKMRKIKHKLESLKGYIFITFVLPLTTYVTAAFWTIFFLNKDFVPSATFALMPSWINHGYHTNGMILVLMDLLFENNSIPPVKSALFGITLLAIVYYSIFFGIYILFGKWLYIFFYEMT